MGESSDGESTDGSIIKNTIKVNFDNLSNTKTITELILKSDQMKKFAIKVTQNKYTVTTELNEELNTEFSAAEFKHLLKIPSRSEISATVIDKKLQIDFVYAKKSKNKSYSISIPLSKKLLDECLSNSNTNKTIVISTPAECNTQNQHVAAPNSMNNTNNESNGTSSATQTTSSQNSGNLNSVVNATVKL